MSKLQGRKEETQGSGGGRKASSSLRPPEQTLRCPRCDSNNTKFCYYNNYNLTQPRHFCKTCRRYWTKGGALRNIPVGGGCRKNKNKPKPCASKFDSSSENGGLKLLDGLPPVPIMEFQLGGISYPPPRLDHQFNSSYGETSSNNLIPFMMNLDPPLGLGFNLPLSTHHATKQGDHHHHHHMNQSGGGLASTFQQMGGFTYTNLDHHNASLTTPSIQSLNQDLHWRLHQQRLAMLGGNDHHQQQQNVKETGLQPILFQNLEITKPTPSSIVKDGNGSSTGMATEWFFPNNYAPVNLNPTSAMNPANDQNGNGNNWNGIQAWNHMNQYTSFP